jgi:hypothetical protein
MRTSWIAIGLAITACESLAPTARESPVTNVREPVAREANLRDHRRTHVEPAAELQVAIAQGRLADARDVAGSLATLTGEGSEPLRQAAHGIAAADDLATMSTHLGNLAQACASCHRNAGVAPAFHAPPLPADDGTLAAQMRRHQWGAARLWEGVTGPSGAQWVAGARVMADTPLAVRQTVHEVPNVSAFELAELLHEQAGAASTVAPDERSAAYADMMQTCARCHAITRPRPVVGVRWSSARER